MKVDFIDSENFSILIENLMSEKSFSPIEAILEACKLKNIEIDTIPELMTPKIRKMLHNEALNLNLLKKSKTRRRTLPL